MAGTPDIDSRVDGIRGDVVSGLSRQSKSLPCKLFYDDRGSHLFDEICKQPEYYPTRTELQILREYGSEIAAAIGPSPLIVEYGSGSSLKTRLLFDQVPDALGYVPIDIAAYHLQRTAQDLACDYPNIAIQPVCADFTRPLSLPQRFQRTASSSILAYFPGSTIGNFEPDHAIQFLQSMRATCGPESGLLIGVDLKKAPNTLHSAYNDSAGVTAAFNLNVLRRINLDLGSDFNLSEFEHYACYNPTVGRIEMHLISRRIQTIDLGISGRIQLEEGEGIHTENSYKYTIQGFQRLAGKAGYRAVESWTDPMRWFSLQYFVAKN